VQFFVNPNAVFGVSWNFVRKVTTADSVYGPIGTITTLGIRRRSTSHRSVKSI